MNTNLLKGYIVSKGYNTISFLRKLNETGIKISRNTWYRNISGQQEFTRLEIKQISEILEMSDTDILKIFFDKEVS